MPGLRSPAELFRTVGRELLKPNFFKTLNRSNALDKRQAILFYPPKLFFPRLCNYSTVPKSGPGNILFILFFIAITIGTLVFLIMNTTIPGSGEGKGTLTGNVTIGPLCPVEPCSVTP